MKKIIEILKAIVKRWTGSQKIQKKDLGYYKLFKKTIDKADREINALSQAIKALQAMEEAGEELPKGEKVEGYDHSCYDFICSGCRQEGRNEIIDQIKPLIAKKDIEISKLKEEIYELKNKKV
jgi:hypothetical protein